MIKSIGVWAFDPQRSAPEIFRMARDNGFDGIELSFGEEGFPLSFQVTAASSKDDCKRLVDEAATAGIKIVAMACGLGWGYPVTCTDPAVVRQGIDTMAAALRVGQHLGVGAVLMVPGGVGAEFIPGFRGAPYEVAYDNALKALNELKAVARETGVSIGVENVWNKFLLSPLEFRDFLDKIDSPNVGCYFDVGNVLLTGYPEQWIKILGHRIKRVHFKDFKRSVGTIDGFCDLLDGDVDYKAVVAALHEVGYQGPVISEFFNCEADLPKISAAMDTILKA